MITVYCDGAVEPKNPGGWGVGGWVAFDQNGSRLVDGTVDLGRNPAMTNNIAEYAAVKAALEYLVNYGLAVGVYICIRTDSKLVVEQLNDRWACRAVHLRRYRDDIWVLSEKFLDIYYEWVPRAQNTHADEMSRSLYGRDSDHA